MVGFVGGISLLVVGDNDPFRNGGKRLQGPRNQRSRTGITRLRQCDYFKHRQPTPPSLDATDISSICSELVAARVVEKIHEELGPMSALGGGGARLKVSLWLECAKMPKGDSSLGRGMGRAAREIFEFGVGFSRHVTAVHPGSMGGSNMAGK